MVYDGLHLSTTSILMFISMLSRLKHIYTDRMHVQANLHSALVAEMRRGLFWPACCLVDFYTIFAFIWSGHAAVSSGLYEIRIHCPRASRGGYTLNQSELAMVPGDCVLDSTHR